MSAIALCMALSACGSKPQTLKPKHARSSHIDMSIPLLKNVFQEWDGSTWRVSWEAEQSADRYALFVWSPHTCIPHKPHSFTQNTIAVISADKAALIAVSAQQKRIDGYTTGPLKIARSRS